MKHVINKSVFKNNICFHFASTNKFKTITFVIKFKTRLNRKNVTKRALLTNILQCGTKSFPTKQHIIKQLANLYGAILHIYCTKKGTFHIIHFQLEIVHDRYLNLEKSILYPAIQLLHEIVYEPYLIDQSFPRKTLQREKRNLLHKLQSRFEDQITYSNHRLIEEMYKGELYSIDKDGYESDLENITAEKLYTYYANMLQEDEIDLFVLGNLEQLNIEEQLYSLFKKCRKNKEKKLQKPSSELKRDKPLYVEETTDLQQAKLHMGFRTHSTYGDSNYSALQIFNGLLAAFPSSKLFLQIREKQQLAYYVASQIDSHEGVLILYCGIDPQNKEQTLSIVKEEIQFIQTGHLCEKEIAHVKRLLRGQLLETADDPLGIIELLYQNVVSSHKMNFSSYQNQIKHVTMEDIITVANRIDLDTIYFLTKGESM